VIAAERSVDNNNRFLHGLRRAHIAFGAVWKNGKPNSIMEAVAGGRVGANDCGRWASNYWIRRAIG